MAEKQMGSLKRDSDLLDRTSLDERYPGNSITVKDRKPKEEEEEEHRVKTAVAKPVAVKKQPVRKRIFSQFFNDDVEDIKGYLIDDVLIPAAKSTITDLVTGGLEKALYGGSRRGGSYSGSPNRTQYNKMSQSKVSYINDKPRNANPRALHTFDDIVLETRFDAEEVLGNLVDLVMDYGSASVADLYDLVGMTSSYTDRKYGWENLSRATVKRVRDGYILELPKARVIE